MFNRIALGGLDRKGVINKGTPEEIKAEVKRLIEENSDRLMVGLNVLLIIK